MAGELRSDERRLAGRILTLLGVLAAVGTAVGAFVDGGGGALSALIGVGLTTLLFGMSVTILLWAAERGHGAAIGVLVSGAAVRVLMYMVVLDLLSTTTWVHRQTLAIATAVSLVVTFSAELFWLARMPRLFWIDLDAARPTAADDSRPAPDSYLASEAPDSRLASEATATRS